MENGMRSSNDQERALDRVKKMLALANDAAASEGERDNALRMAHATLAKYNLSLVDAQGAPQGANEKRVDLALETLCWPWMRTTAHAVAELFFCKYFFVRSKKNYVKHYFVGRMSNATTASGLTKYVIDSIEAEARRAKRRAAFAGPDFVVSFCKGAAHKVYHRCQALREEAEQASQAAPTAQATGTALVLASVYRNELEANSAYLDDVLKLKLKTSASRERRADSGAYHAGAAFGAKVQLNRQLGGTPARVALR